MVIKWSANVSRWRACQGEAYRPRHLRHGEAPLSRLLSGEMARLHGHPATGDRTAFESLLARSLQSRRPDDRQNPPTGYRDSCAVVGTLSRAGGANSGSPSKSKLQGRVAAPRRVAKDDPAAVTSALTASGTFSRSGQRWLPGCPRVTVEESFISPVRGIIGNRRSCAAVRFGGLTAPPA